MSGVTEITDGTNVATGHVEIDSPQDTITTVVTPGANGSVGIDINFQNAFVHSVQLGVTGLGSQDMGATLSTNYTALIAAANGNVAKCWLGGGVMNTSTPIAVGSGWDLEGFGWAGPSYVSPTVNADIDTFSITGGSEWWQLSNFSIIRENAQSLGDWHSGLMINVTSAADFDANGVIDHLYIKKATGEGINCVTNGHGEIRFQGNGRCVQSGGSGMYLGAYDCHINGWKYEVNGLGGLYIGGSDQTITDVHSFNNGNVGQYNYIQVAPIGSTSQASQFAGGFPALTTTTAWLIYNWGAYNAGANGADTFTITVPQGTTAPIAYNATPAAIAAAVSAISGFTGTCTAYSGFGWSANLGTANASVGLAFSNAQATLTITQSQNFALGQAVMYNGAIWICQVAQIAYSGNPSTDTTNWTYPQRPMNAAGRGTANLAPDWGWGYYATVGWIAAAALSSSENAAGGLYLKGVSSASTWDLTVNEIGADPGTGNLWVANPNNAAAVTLDNTSGQIINVAINTSGGWTPALRLINGSTGNIINITNTTVAIIPALSADSTLAGNLVIFNGVNISVGAKVLTPTFANGTAAQLSDTTQNYMVYLNVTTAGTATTLAIGPTSGVANVIKASSAATVGDLYSFLLPAGWYVKWAGTLTAFATQTAISC